MRRGERRILTTHCGSLPRPRELLQPLHAKDTGGTYDGSALAASVTATVRDVVEKQRRVGIDIVNDGEHGKSNFIHYARARLSGLGEHEAVAGSKVLSRDEAAFPDVYAEMRTIYGARYAVTGKPRSRPALACVGPIRYVGHKDIATDIANLSAALGDKPRGDAFMTAISPTNLEEQFTNTYYGSEDEYLLALADAMSEEYKAIVDAGFLLQIDDPRLITYYNRAPGLTMEENRRFIAKRVEVVNHALRGIPEDRVRFHVCYSVNVAPRVHDLELKHFVDLMLNVRAQAYSFEASNPRHEHEWQVWQAVKLPADKILIPGVVSHCVYQVEHPELVAQRIRRFADIVGPERVIASNDCGFATAAAGDEVHPDVAWAKLESLVVGAGLVSCP